MGILRAFKNVTIKIILKNSIVHYDLNAPIFFKIGPVVIEYWIFKVCTFYVLISRVNFFNNFEILKLLLI
jgi:hypothetical protein